MMLPWFSFPSGFCRACGAWQLHCTVYDVPRTCRMSLEGSWQEAPPGPEVLSPPWGFLVLHILPPACSVPLVPSNKDTLPTVFACCGPQAFSILLSESQWLRNPGWQVAGLSKLGGFSAGEGGRASGKARAEPSASHAWLSAEWRAGAVGVRV